MKVDFEKIGLIASYLASNTERPYVTKLLKLFYYIDFVSYNQRGASVTNDTYYKFPYGPVPTLIKNELDLLSNDLMGSGIKTQLSRYILLEDDSDKFGKIVKSKVAPDISKKLSPFERRLVEIVAGTFRITNAKTLSNQTHREKPWLLSSEYSAIDYELSKELNVKKLFPSLVQ